MSDAEAKTGETGRAEFLPARISASAASHIIEGEEMFEVVDDPDDQAELEDCMEELRDAVIGHDDEI
jgi:hypothetical protein